MPAYPFFGAPTLAEFVKALQATDSSVEVKSLKSLLMGPRGPVAVKYVSKGDRVAPYPDIAEDDRLTPTMIRSICFQLDLHCQDVIGEDLSFLPVAGVEFVDSEDDQAN